MFDKEQPCHCELRGTSGKLCSRKFAGHDSSMSELKERHQRPEGRLIEQALKRAPKKSMRKLADEVGLSEGRVRQIVNGYQSHGEGQVIGIVGPADTVARMALAAGVTVEEMRAAGRPDAAEEMNPLRGVGITEEGDLWLSSHEEELTELAAWLEEPEEGRGAPPTRALVLWDVDQLLLAAQERHRDEVRLLNYMIAAVSRRATQEGSGEGASVTDLPLSEPPDTTETSMKAAHESNVPIERGQGHDEHP